jgi:hypothetical protein
MCICVCGRKGGGGVKGNVVLMGAGVGCRSEDVHLRVLAHVRNRSNGDTKVADGAPEVCQDNQPAVLIFQSSMRWCSVNAHSACWHAIARVLADTGFRG